jgi:hypothetical protein
MAKKASFESSLSRGEVFFLSPTGAGLTDDRGEIYMARLVLTAPMALVFDATLFHLSVFMSQASARLRYIYRVLMTVRVLRYL